MFGFGQLIDILKKNPKKIVFTEGNDPRILECSRTSSPLLTAVLVNGEYKSKRSSISVPKPAALSFQPVSAIRWSTQTET